MPDDGGRGDRRDGIVAGLAGMDQARVDGPGTADGTVPPALTLGALSGLKGIRHGFFTRVGGVSTGIYASLNVGFGSDDSPDAVRENRARAMRALGLAPDRLVTVHQVHSADVAVVDEPWPHAQAPKADALATRRRGIALGILTADCVPVLFADAEAGVIAAAHAGWKGALGGILDNTVRAMVDLGARPDRTVAAVGPHIGPDSYEVGPDFPAPFLARDPADAAFFRPSRRAGHHMFDLGGYVEKRLNRAGVDRVHREAWDTLAEPDRFFSYRRTTLRGEADYGRELSAIAMEG